MEALVKARMRSVPHWSDDSRRSVRILSLLSMPIAVNLRRSRPCRIGRSTVARRNGLGAGTLSAAAAIRHSLGSTGNAKEFVSSGVGSLLDHAIRTVNPMFGPPRQRIHT